MSHLVLVLIAIDVFFNVTGQLLLKQGMTKLGSFQVCLNGLPAVFCRAATNIYVILGLCCYVTGFLVWLIVLSKAEVSYAYPLISTGYIFTAILAWMIFGEAVTFTRMAGILITCAGVFLIARG